MLRRRNQSPKTCAVVESHVSKTETWGTRWLEENREAINDKIRRGIAQLDRGEGIPEGELDSYLKELKAKAE